MVTNNVSQCLALKIKRGGVRSVVEYVYRNKLPYDIVCEVMSTLMEAGYLPCDVGGGRVRAIKSVWVDPDRVREFFKVCHNFIVTGAYFPEAFPIGKIRTGKEIVIRPTSLFLSQVFNGGADREIKRLLTRDNIFQAIRIAVQDGCSDDSLRYIMNFLINRRLVLIEEEGQIDQGSFETLPIKLFLKSCHLLRPSILVVPQSDKAAKVPDKVDFCRDGEGRKIVIDIQPLKAVALQPAYGRIDVVAI